jgi:hypothetical protein
MLFQKPSNEYLKDKGFEAVIFYIEKAPDVILKS